MLTASGRKDSPSKEMIIEVPKIKAFTVDEDEQLGKRADGPAFRIFDEDFDNVKKNKHRPSKSCVKNLDKLTKTQGLKIMYSNLKSGDLKWEQLIFNKECVEKLLEILPSKKVEVGPDEN